MLSLVEVVSACSDPGLIPILSIVKKMLNLMQIIGPILAMISLGIHLITLIKNPDDKKAVPKIRNSAIALIVLFMVPTIVNAFFSLLDDSTPLSSCWNNVDNSNAGRGGTYVTPYSTASGSNIYTDPSEYE